MAKDKLTQDFHFIMGGLIAVSVLLMVFISLQQDKLTSSFIPTGKFTSSGSIPFDYNASGFISMCNGNIDDIYQCEPGVCNKIYSLNCSAYSGQCKDASDTIYTNTSNVSVTLAGCPPVETAPAGMFSGVTAAGKKPSGVTAAGTKPPWVGRYYCSGNSVCTESQFGIITICILCPRYFHCEERVMHIPWDGDTTVAMCVPDIFPTTTTTTTIPPTTTTIPPYPR